jgi:two-component system chemotaxis sensor kinase CheA
MTVSDDTLMDPEVLAAFLDESDDSLAGVDLRLVGMETTPDDAETINGIFRAIHSIKGNSAFFGLMRVKRLAHQMEDLLSLMRDKKVLPGRVEISCLLSGLDVLKEMLRNVRQGDPELSPDADLGLEALITRIKAAAIAGTIAPPETWGHVWQDLLQLSELAKTPDDIAAFERLRRTLVTLAPPDAAPKAAPISVPVSVPIRAAAASPAHVPERAALLELEQLLLPEFQDMLPAGPAAKVLSLLQAVLASASGESAEIATQALGEYASLMAAVGFPPILRETLLERVAALKALAGVASPKMGAKTGSAVSRPRESHSRTMRVEETKIDEFLDYVGELIITREMFGNVGKRLRLLREHTGLSTEFQRAMGAFTALSHNLQQSIMEIRKLPIKLVLQKVPRMVRDLAEQEGKDAMVSLGGSEISVDKSLIESFEAPLVHMVRNAVDHGLEKPDERQRRGKPVTGSITVDVSETSDEIVCSIRDDGGGIDADALRAKAVRLGLLTERAAAQLTRQEAYQLVFAAGLSTAKQVTEVSGRGVGMDVVKRNVTDLGGRIVIESVLGQGSTFTVHLPKAVTVQILDGFLVQVGNERLVLPLRSISESFRPTPDQLHTLAERGECVSRRGRVFPLVRFSRLLGLDIEEKSASEAIVVSVQVAGGRAAGLLVDQVLGVQQVVLREVEGIDSPRQVFAGGAVLGDGRVAMVVDVEKLGALVA